MRRRHELTDSQWEKIQHLLPGKASDPGRTAADNRLFVNAVLYVLRTGIPWEDLPARFGKHNTVWKRFDRWCAAGVWGADRGSPWYPGSGGGPTRLHDHQGAPGRLDGTAVAPRKRRTRTNGGASDEVAEG